MPNPRVLVLRAPGTNCDQETAFAFDSCGGQAERVHLFRLLEQPEMVRAYQVLCIPGGFSYGDDVGAGAICGAQLRWRLGEALREFLQADRLVLGICNGFQVLMRAGLLPGGRESWPPREGTLPDATLTWNDNGRYTARWVRLRTAGSACVFLQGVASLYLPIAHAEGKVAVREPTVVEGWRRRGQIALEYVPEDNPNGSTADIAGLCDPAGRVLGLMPHPERHLFPTQHPRWTRSRALPPEGDGMTLFRNAVNYFR